jgi:hypothetical protein
MGHPDKEPGSNMRTTEASNSGELFIHLDDSSIWMDERLATKGDVWILSWRTMPGV